MIVLTTVGRIDADEAVDNVANEARIDVDKDSLVTAEMSVEHSPAPDVVVVPSRTTVFDKEGSNDVIRHFQ